MPAATYDLLLEQGSTYEQTITLRHIDQNPIDLTGWTLAGEIRRSHRSDAVILVFTVDIPSPETGQSIFSLTPAQTRSLAVSGGVYDIEATNPSGKTFRILQGKVTVTPEVTR